MSNVWWLLVPLSIELFFGILLILKKIEKIHNKLGVALIDREVPICAAVVFDEGIIRGHRHHNCITVGTEIGWNRVKNDPNSQGFITSKNRYVNREEAYKLMIASGWVPEPKRLGPENLLFSEDLY